MFYMFYMLPACFISEKVNLLNLTYGKKDAFGASKLIPACSVSQGNYRERREKYL